jgi:AbrB family looped-hinge helix DNA binding protein
MRGDFTTMRKIIKQLRHGQITIPKEMREVLALEDEDLLAITLTGDKLEIEPLKVTPKAEGSPWAARRSREGYSEEEINEAIDEAVREVRSDKA